MSYATKFILVLATIYLGLGIGVIAFSQEEIIEEVILDETVKAEDLGVKEPWLLPDNPFYFIKNWSRAVRSLFAFNKVKKVELESKYANERLLEIKKMVEKNKDPEEIKRATERYKETLEKIKSRVGKIKEKAKDNPEIEKFLDKYTHQQVLHRRVLEKLEERVPPEVYEKIKEAREKHLEKFGEVMTKLEDRKEKIRERLEKTFEEQRGSKYKNFKNLEVLIELEEKVPEKAKEAIKRAEENSLKKLKENLEKMSPEDQERFKKYIEQIAGDKEKHLEILENLRAKIKEKPEFEKKLREARERILKKIPIKIESKKVRTP